MMQEESYEKECIMICVYANATIKPIIKSTLNPPSKIRSKRSGQMMRFKAHDRNYGFFFDSTPI